ncbi:MAG: tetratricopeptide repeat protein, partial [Myxococcales bacterium]|nr:tetratricopeptide repeat protein [Myxococcales bacterium]
MLGSAADGRARPPFGLSFSAGRGLVTLRRHAVAGLVRVESLEMEIPDLRFPFDVSGGARHFRHRRCILRRCELAVSEQELERWLEERVQRAAYGYRRLRLRLRHDHFELSGAVAVGADETEFIARGVVMPTEGRGLAIGLSDVHVYGACALPAPLISAGLLRAAGATPPAERDGRDTAGPLLVGCCDVELDPLGLALLSVLPTSGWRLPSMKVQLCSIDLSPGEMRLLYRADGVEPRADDAPDDASVVGGTVPARFVAAQEARRLFAQAERLVAAGELARAIDVYRRELDAHPQHPFIHQRLLQLLVSFADGDSEVLEACKAARAVLTSTEAGDGGPAPDLPPAVLAEAVVHARNGDPRAAALFRQLAQRAAREQSSAEEVLALLAAGRAEIAHDAARARADFERVLELSRDHPQALAELARLYAEAQDFERLVEVRKRQIGRATDPATRLSGHLALGEIYRVHLGEPELAREQFEHALEIDEASETALSGLAEACIDAEDTLRAVRALDRLGELANQRGDREREIAIHLRIASLWEHLGDRESALTRLRRARSASPTDAQALRRLAALLLSMDRTRDAVSALRQLLDVTREGAAQVAIHRQLAELYRTLGEHPASEREIERALAVDPADPEALHLAIESAERRGEPEALADVLGRAAKAEGDQQRRADLLLRRGRLLARAGRDTDALASFEAAASEASDDGWAARRELARLAAREERWDEARDAWREALATERGQRDADGWRELALIEMRLGDNRAARDALRTASELVEHEDRHTLGELARVCGELGDHAGQRDALEKLVACLPESTATFDEDAELATSAAGQLRQLAELRAAAGEAPGALDLFERARALTPADDSLLWRLVELHEAQQELAAAMPLLEALSARGEIGEQARAS